MSSRADRAQRRSWLVECLLRGLWGVIVMVCYPLATRGAEPPPGTGAAPQPAAHAPTAAPFAILEYQVDGNTLLRRVEVERAVMPYLGDGKTIKDVEAARASLERVYHERGYKTVLVEIPQQRIAEGVVRLHVVEAPVGKLKVLGARYHSPQVIRATMAQLNPGTVPNFPEVQKELGEVNRSADLRVTPVLRASDTPGQVDVDLQVQDQLPLHASLEVNNRYSANTVHVREIGEVRYDNLFQANQSISVQYQVAGADPSEAEIWAVSYVIPTASGPVWAAYYIHSNSNVAAVGSVDVIGNGEIYGLRWIDPLPTNSRDFYHSFTLGADYKDFGQSVFPQGATSSVQSPVSYLPFTFDYTATWLGSAPLQNALAATTGSRSSTTLDLSLEVLLNGNSQQFADKRAGANPNFIILHPSVVREQLLPAQWSLVGRLSGQITNGPLINTEQFAIGGADSVRGYVEAEELGDDGVDGTLELRTPQLLAGHFARVEQSYVSLFYDAARVRILDPLPAQISKFSLASTGVGVRYKIGGFFMALDGAKILKNGSVTPAGVYRGCFRFVYNF